jgi:transcriptional regulator with XRE-family HTH domain
MKQSWVKRYRMQRKLTQQQLAERLGCSIRTITRWENGTLPSKAWDKLLQQLKEKQQ